MVKLEWEGSREGGLLVMIRGVAITMILMLWDGWLQQMLLVQDKKDNSEPGAVKYVMYQCGRMTRILIFFSCQVFLPRGLFAEKNPSNFASESAVSFRNELNLAQRGNRMQRESPSRGLLTSVTDSREHAALSEQTVKIQFSVVRCFLRLSLPVRLPVRYGAKIFTPTGSGGMCLYDE